MRWRAVTNAGTLALAALGLVGCEHFVAAPPSARQINADAGDVVDDRQIVVLARSKAMADSLLSKALDNGYTLISQDNLAGLSLRMLIFEVPQSMVGAAAIRQLEGLEPGVSAGVNHAYQLGQGPPQGRSYAPRILRWPAGGCASRFATVGMIDGTVDRADRGLVDTALEQRSFAPDRPSDETIAHGTTTAILLAGQGRLYNVRLLNAAVVGDYRQRKQVAGADGVLRALNWLQVSGTRLVNISLEGPYNKLLDRAFQQALAGGMIIVASVGNDGPASPPRYPASFRGVVGVTAIDAAAAIYANAPQGAQVTFAAPGVDVFVPVGDRGRYATGTSIAAPFVTAMIAATSGPRERAAAIVNHLARSTLDLGAPGRDPVYGYGLPVLRDRC